MKKKKTPYRKEEPNLELIFQMPKAFISYALCCFAKTLACPFPGFLPLVLDLELMLEGSMLSGTYVLERRNHAVMWHSRSRQCRGKGRE